MSLVENHDLSIVLLNNPFNNIELVLSEAEVSESNESVFVGNHNHELFSTHCAFQ
jgi:hypothetical protein